MRTVLGVLIQLAMAALSPGRGDVPALAEAIAAESESVVDMVFAVGVAFREGSNELGIVGDQGRALCTMQLHHAPRAVLKDARLCVRIGMQRLRDARKACPATPLAGYSGDKCGSRRADWLSRDRWAQGVKAFRLVGVDIAAHAGKEPQ